MKTKTLVILISVVCFQEARFFVEIFSWTSTTQPGIFLVRALWADSGSASRWMNTYVT